VKKLAGNKSRTSQKEKAAKARLRGRGQGSDDTRIPRRHNFECYTSRRFDLPIVEDLGTHASRTRLDVKTGLCAVPISAASDFTLGLLPLVS